MKEDIYGNRVTSILRMTDIKMHLSESIKKVFDQAGFKFHKSAFRFKRKRGKSYEEVFFIFENYHPVFYKIGFSVLCWNEEIQNIKKKFPFNQDFENFDFSSVLLSLGDFVGPDLIKKQVTKWTGLVFDTRLNQFVKNGLNHEVERLTRAQVEGYCYELYDANDLFSGAVEIREKLERVILPTLEQFSTVSGIDNFFLTHPGWSVNSLSLNNITSELISAKLNKKQDLKVVFRQIIAEIENKITHDGVSKGVKGIIEEVYEYLS